MSAWPDIIEHMFDDNVEWVPKNLELIPPGAVLAAMLDDISLEGCDGHDRVRVLAAHERMKTHYQSRSYRAMNAVADSLRADDLDDEFFDHAVEAASAEIAAALRLTRRTADREMTMALDLHRRLPIVLRALEAGQIDLARARVLVNGTLHLSVAAARDTVARIIDDAARLTTGQLGAKLRTVCIEVDPDESRARYEHSVADRRVVVEATVEGTANLLAFDVPPDKAAAAKKRLTELAMERKNQGDPRSIDQLRADILLELVNGDTTANGSGGGILDLATDLETLAGLADHPGELAGYGPVIADIARQVAEHQRDGEWRWTLIDPDTRRPIDAGITRRRPTKAQRRLVETRHCTCIHPGCRMPSINCDLDHRVPWSEQQITDTSNLAPLCRYHHRIRHQAGWRYRPLPNGDYLFTTPLNHKYTSSGRPP